MNKYFDIAPRVFYPSLIIILSFVLISILGGNFIKDLFANLYGEITSSTGWLFILGVNLFIVFLFGLPLANMVKFV